MASQQEMEKALSLLADRVEALELSYGNGIANIHGDEGRAHLQAKVRESLSFLKTLRKQLGTADKVIADQAEEITNLKARAAKYEYQIKHLKKSLTEEEEKQGRVNYTTQ